MVTRYIRTPDGRLVAVPTPAPTIPEDEPVEEEAVEEESKSGTRDADRDLIEVTTEEIMGSEGDNPLQELDEGDVDDLFGVSREDVMGEPSKPRRPKRRLIRRTNKPYYPPPQSIIRPG